VKYLGYIFIWAALLVFCDPLGAADLSGETSYRLNWNRITSYSKTDYGAGIQNWSITQGEDGIMYFANNDGLLSYDGSQWELFPHPDKLIIRAVARGTGSRVYAGTYEDFGYWERDEGGNMQYSSLKGLVEDFNFNNNEIWKIQVQGDSVWFQSFTVLFLYNQGKVETIHTGGVVTCFTSIGENLFARITGRGLFRINGNGTTLVDSSAFFKEKMIRVILPYQENKLLVATSNDGIFVYSGPGQLEPWRPGEENLMVDRVVNRGLVTDDGMYVFGTQLDGIHVFDQAGRKRYSMTQENGLQNNTVLSLYADRQGYLWSGLDNGIDLVDLNSGISFFRDLQGRIGAVYTMLLHEGILYAGTNKGLFYSDLNTEPDRDFSNPEFTLLPGSESQVWSLEHYGDQVFCGHNDGTYEVQDLEWKEVSETSGAYSLKPLNGTEEEYLLQSTYTDLVFYKKEDGRWNYHHYIGDFNQPIKYIASDHLGNIWAGHNTKGLFRVTLTEDLRTIKQLTYYGEKNGFRSDYQIGVFEVNHRVVFLNEGEFFTYDDLQDTIVPYELLKPLAKNDRFHKIMPAFENHYWFISDKHLKLFRIEHEQVEPVASYPFDLFENRQIRGFEFVHQVNAHQSVLTLDNGFALLSHASLPFGEIDEEPLFKKITASGGKRSLALTLNLDRATEIPEIKYNLNSLTFVFACPVYGTGIRYRIMLEGLEEEWKQISDPEYRYDRLPAGAYTLHLMAVDALDNETAEITWSFQIMAPWYWSIVSKALYVLLFVLLLFVIIKYFLKRLNVQEQKLTAEKESEIIKIRNEKLRSEISYKSKELANTTFNIMKKNELLMEIRQALEKELKSSQPEQRRSFSRIARLVDRNISHEEDWKVFESNFERAHEEFLFRIRENYPLLTPGDLKLCAYLRMNLSTKKIALLLGISVRGVENHRYRLRKKLNLDKETNLTEYLMGY
jgi:DNA-binding CsgD family transcriptional regulator